MADQPHVKIRPKEFKGFLLNPHKGCATFQHFAGDPLYPGVRWNEAGPTEFPAREFEGVTPGYLPCSVAYCRWFWELVEPEEGKFDFTVVEKSLETARERGQTLQVRLMPHGSATQPALPKWYVEKYPTTESRRFAKSYTVAVYDSPEYIDRWGALIAEFGRRFDGHPDLETVDMSYLGAWGEGDGKCSNDAIDLMTKIYRDAHPKTPILAMISGYKMTAGVRAGTGWRCDSCDDLGLWGDQDAPLDKRWNHLYDSYPRSVCEAGAQDAWKTAPVAYEPGKVFMDDHERGFDIDFIIQQDLKYHGSIISMKSTRLPEEWMDKLRDFCNDLGYRYVLRQFQFDARAKRGGMFEYTCWIENVGVAPIYRRYDFAVKLTQGNRTHVYRSPVDIRKILPGDAWIEEQIDVPKEFQPGSIMLHTGLIDRKIDEPKVRFAVEGADHDGWMPLDTIEIT